jgi:hypothetical protein
MTPSRIDLEGRRQPRPTSSFGGDVAIRLERPVGRMKDRPPI